MKKFWSNPLDEEIDKLIDSLDECRKTNTKEYIERLEALGKLYEAKAKISPVRQLDPNVILTLLGSLVSTAYIITAERTDVVGRSKSWNERPKITVRTK